MPTNVKFIWQMTLKEVMESLNAKKSDKEYWVDYHIYQIQEALSEGEKIPIQVLAEYPDHKWHFLSNKEISTVKKNKNLKKSRMVLVPRTSEIEVGKERADKITQKRTFEYFDRPTVGDEFFIFRQKGDELSGQIVGHAIANVRRNSSYPLKLASGKIVEFFANKQLHGIIRDFELVRAHVRIVYIGRNHNSWGHAAKVYRVFKNKDGSESGPLVSHLKNLKSKRSEKDV